MSMIYKMVPEFHFRPSICRRSWDCWITGRTGSDTTHLVQSVTFEPHDDLSLLVKPTMQLHVNEVQALMDALWMEGVRPAEQGTAGQLAAVSYHLEDMRRLVFKGES